MFGYVKPVAQELLVKEQDFYRATYCGICRAMKRHTGVFSNMTLSYDSVLLALVRMLFVPDEEISAKMQTCIAHPFKKRCMVCENPAIEYTARAFAIFTYYKVKDDMADEGFMKRAMLLGARPIASAAHKKAKMPELSEIIKTGLEKITALENAGEKSVDAPAHLFGEILGEVFAYGIAEREAIVLREFGYHLGCFKYAADAAEDYDSDKKAGKYNPYVAIYDGCELTEENKQSIKCALILHCKGIERAMDLLPFGNRGIIEGIVKNIVYLGLVKRISFLDCEQNDKKGENK